MKQTLEEYFEILKITVEYHMNSIAREITRTIMEQGGKIDINYFNFSLKFKNFSYVWYLITFPIIYKI